MERWSGRSALVTGAASGIGFGIARAFVENGMNVVGVDISKERLQKAENDLKNLKGSFTSYECDVTNDVQVLKLFQFIKEKYGATDVCVNNAGIFSHHSLLEGNPTVWRKLLDINVVAYCHIAKLAIEAMRREGIDDGHIFNICSAGGHKVYSQAPSSAHFYMASKFAIRAITEGLRNEMKELDSKIRVSQISPGMVRSNIMDGITPEAAKIIEKAGLMETSEIAQCITFMLALPEGVEVNDMILTSTANKMAG